MHSLIQGAYLTAKNLIVAHKDKLIEVSKYLIEHETLEGPALTDMLNAPPALLPEPSGGD